MSWCPIILSRLNPECPTCNAEIFEDGESKSSSKIQNAQAIQTQRIEKTLGLDVFDRNYARGTSEERASSTWVLFLRLVHFRNMIS